jgi:hypothetical protein
VFFAGSLAIDARARSAVRCMLLFDGLARKWRRGYSILVRAVPSSAITM